MMGGDTRQTRPTFLAGAAACSLSASMFGCRRSRSDRKSLDRLPELDMPPPPVPRFADARRHAGARLLYLAESVGNRAAIDRALALRFGDDSGVVVSVVLRPRDATETYAGYQRLFQARSADVDVVSLDVTWPGVFAPHLFDLGPILCTPRRTTKVSPSATSPFPGGSWQCRISRISACCIIEPICSTRTGTSALPRRGTSSRRWPAGSRRASARKTAHSSVSRLARQGLRRAHV